jgi:hypothetical protein
MQLSFNSLRQLPANVTTSAAAAMPVGLSSLPDQRLKLVLQHVPFKHRLSSCCLVNKRLHAAAVAATQDLQLWFGDDQSPSKGTLIPRSQEGSTLDWFTHYSQHLTRLQLDRFQQPLQQLPCPNLLDLKLNCGCAELGLGPSYCRLQLGAADGQPGVIQGCTKLTRLELYCDITDAPEGSVIDSLSSLVHLQHLDVRAMKFVANRGVECALGGFSGATLPCLQHLTAFTGWLSVENMQQLGELSCLKQLNFAVESSIAIGPSSVPGLVFPSSLTYLCSGTGVEAGLLSLVPSGLRALRLDEVAEGPAEGPSSLLSCMSRLQHLTQLVLECGDTLDWPPASCAYSALTASSHLVQVGWHGFELPQGAWSHVFPFKCKQLHLTCLYLSRQDEDDMAWSAAEVSNLVSCCPNLRELNGIILEYGPHVSELQQLSALTKLHAHYPSNDWFGFEGSLEGLVTLTGLRYLRITMSHGNHDAAFHSFEPLTRLTALTHLYFSNKPAGGPRAFTFSEMDFSITAQVGVKSAQSFLSQGQHSSGARCRMRSPTLLKPCDSAMVVPHEVLYVLRGQYACQQSNSSMQHIHWPICSCVWQCIAVLK